jgi:hypothetical protein
MTSTPEALMMPETREVAPGPGHNRQSGPTTKPFTETAEYLVRTLAAVRARAAVAGSPPKMPDATLASDRPNTSCNERQNEVETPFRRVHTCGCTKVVPVILSAIFALMRVSITAMKVTRSAPIQSAMLMKKPAWMALYSGGESQTLNGKNESRDERHEH